MKDEKMFFSDVCFYVIELYPISCFFFVNNALIYMRQVSGKLQRLERFFLKCTSRDTKVHSGNV